MHEMYTVYSWPRVILVATHQLLMQVKSVDQAPKCDCLRLRYQATNGNESASKTAEGSGRLIFPC